MIRLFSLFTVLASALFSAPHREFLPPPEGHVMIHASNVGGWDPNCGEVYAPNDEDSPELRSFINTTMEAMGKTTSVEIVAQCRVGAVSACVLDKTVPVKGKSDGDSSAHLRFLIFYYANARPEAALKERCTARKGRFLPADAKPGL